MTASTARLAALVALVALAIAPAARAACASACLSPSHATHGAAPRQASPAPAAVAHHVHGHHRAASVTATAQPASVPERMTPPPCCAASDAAPCRDRGPSPALAPRTAEAPAPVMVVTALATFEPPGPLRVQARSVPLVRPPGTASAPLPLRI